MLKVRGSYIDNNTVVILTDYAENGSLHSFLHSKSKSILDTPEKIELNEDFKYKIAYQISLGLDFLHKQNPPMVHGNLTSSNVLVIDFMNIQNNLSLIDLV